LDIFVLGRSGD